MSENRSIFLTILKILSAVFYALVTAYLVYGLIDVLSSGGNVSLGIAVYLTFSVIILGSIGYIITLIPAIIGLISSIAKEAGLFSILYFVVFILLPIITEGVIIIICQSYAS